MSPRLRAAARITVVMIAAILLQTTVGPDLRIHGVAPDLMALLASCAGIAGGAEQGALVGFASGLLADLFLQDTPFGLSALAFCLVGFLVGWLRSNVLHQRWVLTPIIAGAGTVAAVLLFIVLGKLVGQDQLFVEGKRWIVEVAIIDAIESAILSIPVTALLSRAAQGSTGAATVLAAVEGPIPAGGAPRARSRASARERDRRRRRSGDRTRIR
jgi:rod shape-determining protein MreD